MIDKYSVYMSIRIGVENKDCVNLALLFPIIMDFVEVFFFYFSYMSFYIQAFIIDFILNTTLTLDNHFPLKAMLSVFAERLHWLFVRNYFLLSGSRKEYH